MKTKLLLISFLVFSFSSLTAQNLNDQLLIYYPLDGNALDFSGNDFHGNGNASPAQNRFREVETAMEFNGIDTYIDFPNHPDLEPGFPFSIAFWVYCKGEATAILSTDFANDTHSGAWFGRGSDETLNFAIGDAGGNTSPNQRVTLITDFSVEDYTWYHVAVTRYNAYDADIWVNAVKRSFYSTGFATDIGYTNAPGSLGRKDENVISDPRYFTGLLDEFYFWNRSISQEDVDILFYGNGLSSTDESTWDQNDVITFPNPTSGILQLKLPGGYRLEHARVISLEGKLVKEINSFSGTTLDLTELPNGFYALEIHYDDSGNKSAVSYQKVLITH